jgi:hypothetical protein
MESADETVREEILGMITMFVSDESGEVVETTSF